MVDVGYCAVVGLELPVVPGLANMRSGGTESECGVLAFCTPRSLLAPVLAFRTGSGWKRGLAVVPLRDARHVHRAVMTMAPYAQGRSRGALQVKQVPRRAPSERARGPMTKDPP